MKSRRQHSFKRGRWQVQRERCRIEPGHPPPPDGEPTAVGDVVPGLLKKLGLESQHWLAALDEDWTAIVGPAVAAHTRPGRVERSELVVFVDSSVWLSELSRYGKGKILDNVRKRFGKSRIRFVRLQLDPDG